MPILSGNADVNNAVIAGNDGDFAERVRIVSWKDGREDPERPAREIEAPLVKEGRQTQSLSGDRSGQFLGNIRTGGAVLKPDPVKYPDLVVKKDDEVIALDRPGNQRWKVSSVDDRGHGRIFINLGEI
ncbi:hypothetical protein AB1K42_15225 [Roseibium algicola]|uniref:hypothetical protein n=1 Tax=Roseibium algicola TaxID=2857014 RepID=UPI00345900A2